MPDTTTALATLRHPAFARALDAGHAAAAAGQWSAAAARFTDALDAAAPHGPDHGRAPDAAFAVALSNLGQALARAGRWDDAADALRRAADAREALVHAGLATAAVAARGWSDVAALLAAAGPEDDAREALRRARSHAAHAAHGADDALDAALRETAALLGESEAALEMPPAADAAEPALDDAAADDETVDADWRPTPVFDASVADDGDEDLDALLALAAGPTEPERPAVELDGGDSMAAALDAAIEWTPTPAHDLPAVPAAPTARDDGADAGQNADDDLDAEPELLTPGVDFAELHAPAPAATRGHGAPAAARGQRLAAIDAIVELTEERQAPKSGGLRGLFRKLTGR